MSIISGQIVNDKMWCLEAALLGLKVNYDTGLTVDKVRIEIETLLMLDNLTSS